MPAGTRKELRRYVAKRRRQRSWWVEQKEFQKRPENLRVEKTRTLAARSRDGREMMAVYEKTIKGWRLGTHHHELVFLTWCGMENAAAALRNRGFTFEWV